MNDFNSIPATAADTTDQITNAGEPVTDQAPAKLPTDYMKNGFLNTSPNGKPFLKSEYVGAYAQEIAAALTAGATKITAAAFNSAFLRDTKKHLRRGTPYEAKATCAAAMVPQAIKLVAKHKAPSLLRDMIAAAVGAVSDDPTFEALYQHFDAVYCYLLDREGGDNE